MRGRPDEFARLYESRMAALQKIMAAQLAHERLIEAALLTLATAFPADRQRAFLDSLHEIAETWKTADVGIFGADIAAPARASAAETVRQVSDLTHEIVERIRAHLAPAAGGAAV